MRPAVLLGEGRPDTREQWKWSLTSIQPAFESKLYPFPLQVSLGLPLRLLFSGVQSDCSACFGCTLAFFFQYLTNQLPVPSLYLLGEIISSILVLDLISLIDTLDGQ